MEHCWGKKMQQTTSEVTVSTLWNTDQTSGGLWSHPVSTNAGAPRRKPGSNPTDRALPSPWFLCSSEETPLEGSLGSWALVADTWYPLQNALSPVPRTDPLQMQDYSSATGNESPIAPLWADNANSHHGRQKQYTCCDTFISLSYSTCTYYDFLWPIHTVQDCSHRLIPCL